MKKLICNICSITLGIIASILAFLPMFDTVKIVGEKSFIFDTAFGLFTENELSFYFSDYSSTLKLISAIFVGICIALVVAILLISIVDMIKSKKVNNVGFKKFIGLLIVFLSIAFVVTTLMFITAHSVTTEISKITIKLTISNWAVYLLVPVCYFLSGVFALVADNKK